MALAIHEVFDGIDPQALNIDESFSGPGILGRIKEAFLFVPNGQSRNKRFYSMAFWVKQLRKPNLLERMTNGLLLGTIGHVDKPLDDLCRDGEAAYKINRLWITEDGKRGLGEVDVLDTPTGRVFKAMTDAGIRFRPSTKGEGTFLQERTDDGLACPDPDNYFLERVDAVTDPGFVQAAFGAVCESLTEEYKPVFEQMFGVSAPKKEVKVMTDVLIDPVMQQLTEQKVRLEGTLKDTAVQLEATGTKLATAEQFIKLHGGEADIKEAHTAHVIGANSAVELGTSDEIREAMISASTALAEYQQLGSAADIDEALTTSASKLQEFAAIGTADEFDRTCMLLQEVYDQFGSQPEIAQVFDLLENILTELGTPADVEAALNHSLDIMRQNQESRLAETAVEFADKHNITETAASALLTKFEGNVVEAAEVVSGIARPKTEASAFHRYRQPFTEGVVGESGRPAPRSRIQQLFEATGGRIAK